MSNRAFITLLGLLLVVLKLGGAIDWSWWFVTLPFWYGFGLMAVTLASVFMFGICILIYRWLLK